MTRDHCNDKSNNHIQRTHAACGDPRAVTIDCGGESECAYHDNECTPHSLTHSLTHIFSESGGLGHSAAV